jgi:hypothetical protein
MSIRLRPASWLILGILLFGVFPSNARQRQHWGEGFSVDLNHPYDQVLSIVQQVTNDGIIRGTYQYKGTNQLDGAESARSSSAFPKWTGGGTVLYKVRPNTLAPEHFYQSGDKGTVAVRYIVQPAGPNSTQVRINAIFQEDDRHHSHPSDGLVESNEFEAIAAKIKDLEDAAARQREEEAQKKQQQQVDDLQAELDREDSALAAAREKEQQLQSKRPESSAGNRTARVRTASAELKAAPYNQSRTLQALSQGDTVKVLSQTRAWYRVQNLNGQQGWVYRLMLEVAP